MHSNSYDVIVVGIGGVGSAALFHLANKGARVLGIDRYAPPHDHGSSHGHTRVIRKAYFEHPDYVPLLEKAYDEWYRLESLSEQQLYVPTGLLEVGPAHGTVVPGVLRSAKQYDLPVDELSPSEVESRFPGFKVPEGSSSVLERDAGYLLVENCVAAYLKAASHQGAVVQTGREVRGWKLEDNTIRVDVEGESVCGKSLVITTGAWSGKLLADLGVRLRLLRKHLHWYACPDARYHSRNGCPVFFYETGEGSFFYGFPQLDLRGVKVSEHSGGEEVGQPAERGRSLDTEDQSRVEAFLTQYLPGVSKQATDHAVCLYSMTADGHFVVDHHPLSRSVVFAAGLSGHGFKFASALGQALAEMALDGGTALPIGFLRSDRPSLKP